MSLDSLKIEKLMHSGSSNGRPSSGFEESWKFDETLIGKEFLISVNELRESINAAIQITEEMIEDKNYE